MTKEKMYESAKGHVENILPMPKIEEFNYGTTYDETDELKTRYKIGSDGCLMYEYDYIETVKYPICDYLSYSNEQYKINIRYPYDWYIPEDKQIEIEIVSNRKVVYFNYE